MRKLSKINIEKIESKLYTLEELAAAYPIDLHFPQTYEEATRPIIIRKDSQDEQDK